MSVHRILNFVIHFGDLNHAKMDQNCALSVSGGAFGRHPGALRGMENVDSVETEWWGPQESTIGSHRKHDRVAQDRGFGNVDSVETEWGVRLRNSSKAPDCLIASTMSARL